MNPQIYRKQALERLASPEQLDQLMPITRPRAWVALVGVALLMLMALIWSVFGSVTTVVEGFGTLQRLDGVVELRAPTHGRLSRLSVKVDDLVQKGQALAILLPAGDGNPQPINLVSPADGRILNVLTHTAQSVAASQVLLMIEKPQQPLSGILYVAAPEAYQVNAGMEVKILPATSSKNEAAYLLGHVSQADRYPTADPQSTGWYVTSETAPPVFKILVNLTPKTSRPEIYSGTPCQALITVEKRRPIEIIFSGPNR